MKIQLKLFTVADMILICALVAMITGSYFLLFAKRDNLKAYIYYRNKLLGTYEISNDADIRINESCLAEIRNGKIRVIQSNCPDKRCVKQGWSDLLPIICLPNQINIEVKSADDKKQMHFLH